ncbi:hypothetical protein M9H77_13503 [Catharanthus roseus]|uniref:Uncharacterized protein n=1 Tax=Catharanthus roseus TaxID=4058 RepID=A0ACC0BKJ6_CATRO|nr:hypothetical protein M9H77_13503 [Catharanthus roseus]
MEAMLTTPTSHKSTCSYCRISGHEIANCYQLIGFPDWWERNRAKASRGSSLDRDRERTGGGRSNSYPHATRGKGHGQGRAHSGWADAVIDNGGRLQAMSGAHNDWVNAAIEGGRGLQITAPGTSANSGIPGLSTEQWKSLLNILQNQANSNRLSSGAEPTCPFPIPSNSVTVASSPDARGPAQPPVTWSILAASSDSHNGRAAPCEAQLNPVEGIVEDELRRSSQVRQVSTRLKDYICNTV